MEQALLVTDVESLGGLTDVLRGQPGFKLAFALDELVQAFALDQGPGQVMHAAGGTDVQEGHHSRMLALLERAHLAAGDAHVPHAAPGQDLDGVPLVVVLRLGLVNRPHTA